MQPTKRVNLTVGADYNIMIDLNGYLKVDEPVVIKVSKLGVNAEYLGADLLVENIENHNTFFQISFANEKDPSVIEPEPTEPVEPEPTEPVEPNPTEPDSIGNEQTIINNPRTMDMIIVDVLLLCLCMVWFIIGVINLNHNLKNKQ